ncbi:MAG: hypothetical protein ACRDCY_05825 [Aeromonas veronii]
MRLILLLCSLICYGMASPVLAGPLADRLAGELAKQAPEQALPLDEVQRRDRLGQLGELDDDNLDALLRGERWLLQSGQLWLLADGQCRPSASTGAGQSPLSGGRDPRG